MQQLSIDTSDLLKGIGKVNEAVALAAIHGINDVASEILRLSTFEVPHDTGMLQASGHIEQEATDDVIVGYNKVYAARLHEHPEYHFQKGRKGKYLEDPIKNNMNIFIDYVRSAIGDALK